MLHYEVSYLPIEPCYLVHVSDEPNQQILIFFEPVHQKIYKPTPSEGKTRPIWWIPKARLNVGGKSGQTGDQLFVGRLALLRSRLAQGAVEWPAYPCVDLVAPWDTAPPSGKLRNCMRSASFHRFPSRLRFVFVCVGSPL